MPSNAIRYVGFDKLSEDEQDTVKKIIEEESIKITRMINDMEEMVVAVKTHKAENAKRRVLLSLRIITPKKRFAVQTNDRDTKKAWDLPTAAHNIMDKAVSEIKHALKADDESWKRNKKIRERPE